jgi:hypothetical protein
MQFRFVIYVRRSLAPTTAMHSRDCQCLHMITIIRIMQTQILVYENTIQRGRKKWYETLRHLLSFEKALEIFADMMSHLTYEHF